jgi:hypothetical protein
VIHGTPSCRPARLARGPHRMIADVVVHEIVRPLSPRSSFAYEYMFTRGLIRVAEKSAIERIRELDAERATLFEQAKEEALKKATDAITDLIALGLDYQLISGAAKPAKSGKVLGTAKDVPCPICKFLTIPPHDRRTHRNQKKKAPFSAAELKEKGLVKV